MWYFYIVSFLNTVRLLSKFSSCLVVPVTKSITQAGYFLISEEIKVRRNQKTVVYDITTSLNSILKCDYFFIDMWVCFSGCNCYLILLLAIKFTLRHYPFLHIYLDVFISYQTHIANFINIVVSPKQTWFHLSVWYNHNQISIFVFIRHMPGSFLK